MHSDAILRGLSVASYILTVVIFMFLYSGILTPWSFVALFVFIWMVLAAVVMHRSSKYAERELAQKMFQLMTEKSKSKEVQDIVSQMKSKFPYGSNIN